MGKKEELGEDDDVEEQFVGGVLRQSSGDVSGELLGVFNGGTLEAPPWWREEEERGSGSGQNPSGRSASRSGSARRSRSFFRSARPAGVRTTQRNRWLDRSRPTAISLSCVSGSAPMLPKQRNTTLCFGWVSSHDDLAGDDANGQPRRQGIPERLHRLALQRLESVDQNSTGAHAAC
nr:unnamed protein product [Digitaria exilis]